MLFHECCVVNSFMTRDDQLTSAVMSDETIHKLYHHSEKAAGIGFKCQLCGKR